MSDATWNGTAASTCPEKETLVALLYGEVEEAERQSLAEHLRACADCSSEMTALEEVRGTLTAWSAPELTRGFEVVPRPSARSSWWPAVGYAAAAALILGVSAGMANLELRYGSGSLTVRTGWSQPVDSPGAGEGSPGGPAVTAASLPTSTRPSDDAWRTELAALETRLRAEWGSREQALPNASPAPVPASIVESRTPSAPVPADWVRQVQRLVDESEVRQQQNLALRIAEVSRDFELQRRVDLVEVQQGLGQLGIDATQHKQMWDYFRRVSQEPR